MKHALLKLAVVVALSGPALSHADGVVAETRIQTSYPTNDSFDVVSDRNAVSGFDFGVGWEFERLAGLRTLLMFQTIAPGRLSSSLFAQAVAVEWGRQRVFGALDWGVTPWPWLRPFARVGVGYSHQFLAVSAEGPRLKDHAHDLAGFGSAGLELRIPVGFGSLGASSQLGYAIQTPATFDELRHDDDAFSNGYADREEGDPWARAESSFGALNTNSVFWDVGLTARVDF